MKNAKQRIIYDSYDLWEQYADDAREILAENGNQEPSEEEIWEEIYFYDEVNWSEELERLQEFFDGSRWLAMGTVGLWTGRHAAGDVFDCFDDFFHQAARDCSHWKIWDENGHLYFQASHHDGTNCFEIKRLTERGADVLENWLYSWEDQRSEAELHRNAWKCNIYTALPHFAHTVYGCPKKEVTR